MSLLSRRLLLLGTATAGARQPVPMSQRAPELVGDTWINATTPQRIQQLAGKVVFVHFWTYGCYNCKNNLPPYRRLEEKYGARGVAFLGVHTPEFDHERVLKNVEAKVREFGVKHPTLVDNGYENWRRWKQQFWPCLYLVDKKGQIRARWEGELNYGNLHGEEKISKLLDQLLGE